MSGLRLLQLNVTGNWGSTGKIAEGIGLAAMHRGWESTVAFGRYVNPSASQLIKVGGQRDVYLHYARSRFLDGEGLGSRGATQRLIGQIKELAPDIIQLHNIHDHWLNYPLLFEYLATIDTPVVWTFHDCWAFTGGCAYFDRADCNKWQRVCESCPSKHGFLDKSKRNFILKRDLLHPLRERLHLVPVSNWLHNFLKDSFLSECKSTVIYNGINLNSFKIVPYERERHYVLGVALPWSARKGFEDVLKLRTVLPNEIDIVLVGLTEAQLKQLPDGVVGYLKTQNIEQLVELYSGALALINPTYEDNFPTVNIEALACGTPVITYNTGGSPEAIIQSTGIVVEQGDVKQMTDAVMRIFNNPAKYSSTNCRKRAQECFDATKQYNKYIDLYESILSEK